jgi:hypothetical protein
MSHGGGGGGFGHGGGGHHGGHHGVHGGGHPDQLPSWNSALQGEKRTGRFANLSPKPIFIAFLVFSVMLVPFVLDWDEPQLQRLLIGHDLTPKEIAHQNAVNMAVAGTMRQQAGKVLGSEVGDALIPQPAMSGSALIAEPASPSSIPDNAAPADGNSINNFSISAAQPAAPLAGSMGGQIGGQIGGQPAAYQGAAQNYAQPTLSPTLGSNQRFISQPGYGVAGAQVSGGGGEYRGPRYKVVVDR